MNLPSHGTRLICTRSLFFLQLQHALALREICTLQHPELNNHLPVLNVLHSLVHVGCGHPEVCDQHVGKYGHSSDGTQT